MKQLADLVKGIPCEIHGDSAVEIKGIAYHSGRVESGYLFVAIDGFRVSGADYIDEAINRGATAVATTDLRRVTKNWVTGVVTGSPRRMLAQVANRFYGFPARKLDLIGITGTNGKTTTAYLLRQMAREMGIEPGFVGTVEYWDGERSTRAGQTTPESLDLVRILDRLASHEVPMCIVEVSSHALELDRVFDLDFKVRVFTNLSQDHLDFHRTFREYQEAKLKLFADVAPTSFAVVNIDDRVGRTILDTTRARVLSFGTRADLEPVPDLLGEVKRVGPDGLEAEVRYQDKTYPVRLKLAGRYNLYNLLAAFGTGCALGWPVEAIVRGAEALASVPGRLERVGSSDRGFRVYVDYAHTPDALRNVLETAREFTGGRVIVVFGCGGNRDRDKRPKMGATAAGLADLAVVTSDNPRGESPEEIIKEIRQGMETGKNLVEPDRRAAIARALELAGPGDTVIVAGKGHEEYQTIGNEKLEFDDRQVVRELLDSLGGKA